VAELFDEAHGAVAIFAQIDTRSQHLK
jgi:hypothetical protein